MAARLPDDSTAATTAGLATMATTATAIARWVAGWRAIVVLGLLCVPLPLFVAANNGDYLWTDTLEIGAGGIIRTSPRALLDAIRTGIEGHYYRPTIFLLHALDFALFGDRPIAFRLTNLCLHQLNVLLLFVTIRRLFKDAWIALATAALFAVHPLVATPLAWASDRTDLVSLTASLGFFLFAHKYLNNDAHRYPGVDRRASASLAAACACLVLGLGAKETVAATSAVMLVVCVCSDGVNRRRFVNVIIAQAALLAGWFWWRNHVGTNSVRHLGSIAAGDRLAMASYIHLEYLWQLLVPYRLTVCDGMRIPPHRGLWMGAGLVMTAAVAVVGAIAAVTGARFARNQREPGGTLAVAWTLAWAWTIAFLVPSSGILALKHMRADRYLYCALPGMTLLLVLGGRALGLRLAGRRWVSVAMFAVCYLYLSASLLLRSQRFMTDVALWDYETSRNEWCLEGDSYLAHAALLANRLPQALVYCDKALAVSPGVVAYVDTDATTYLKALVLAEGGHTENATIILDELMKTSDSRAIRAEAAYELGLIAVDRQAYQLAVDDLNLALAIGTSTQSQRDIFLVRSYAYLRLGDVDACRQDLARFDALGPGKPNPVIDQLLGAIRPALAP